MQVSTPPAAEFYTAHILKAYDYAYRMGAHVVSCSFGPNQPVPTSPEKSESTVSVNELADNISEGSLYRAAIQPLVKKNMLIIAAAGGCWVAYLAAWDCTRT